MIPQRITLACNLLAVLALAPVGFAKPTSTSVAFVATTKANEDRHIGMKSGGGLILGSKIISGKEIFNLLDLNGGALQDGDSVQLATNGPRPTYWQESQGKVNRIGGKPGAASAFKVKWKQKGKTLSLRTASGKFVSGPGKGKDLIAVSNASDPNVVFELVKNPVAAPKRPAKPKASASQATPSKKVGVR